MGLGGGLGGFLEYCFLAGSVEVCCMQIHSVFLEEVRVMPKVVHAALCTWKMWWILPYELDFSHGSLFYNIRPASLESAGASSHCADPPQVVHTFDQTFHRLSIRNLASKTPCLRRWNLAICSAEVFGAESQCTLQHAALSEPTSQCKVCAGRQTELEACTWVIMWYVIQELHCIWGFAALPACW